MECGSDELDQSGVTATAARARAAHGGAGLLGSAATERACRQQRLQSARAAALAPRGRPHAASPGAPAMGGETLAQRRERLLRERAVAANTNANANANATEGASANATATKGRRGGGLAARAGARPAAGTKAAAKRKRAPAGAGRTPAGGPRKPRKSAASCVSARRPRSQAPGAAGAPAPPAVLRRRTHGPFAPDLPHEALCAILRHACGNHGGIVAGGASARSEAPVTPGGAHGEEGCRLATAAPTRPAEDGDGRGGTALPTAAYFACVCRAWRRAAAEESGAWRWVSLRYGWCRPTDRVVGTLLASGRWRHTEALAVGGHREGALTDATLRLLPASCPALRSLAVGPCVGCTIEALAGTIEELPALADLELGEVKLGATKRCAARLNNATEMRALLPVVARAACARRLVRLCLRGAALGAAEARVLLAPGAWPALRELDLTRATHAGTVYACPAGKALNLPWVQWSSACPGLKRCLLTGVGGGVGCDLSAPSSAPAEPPAGGALELEVLELGNARVRWGNAVHVPKARIPPPALRWMLSCARLTLRRLDMTDRPEFVRAHLATLMAAHPPLEELLIARTGAVHEDAVDGTTSALATVLRAAGSCRGESLRLEILDVSGGCLGADDASLAVLGARAPRLGALDLSGTFVSDEGLATALLGAGAPPRLRTVHVEGCRHLSRRVRIAGHGGRAAAIKTALRA